MGLLTPEPPPYDPLEWAQRPFPERARMACQSWATQGYGTPIAVYFVYALKVALYIGALARPELVALSRRWFDGLVTLLSTFTDPTTARLLAVFVDGACMHAALHDEPLDLALLEHLTRTLMEPK